MTTSLTFALGEIELPHSPFLPSGFQSPEFLTMGPLGSPRKPRLGQQGKIMVSWDAKKYCNFFIKYGFLTV